MSLKKLKMNGWNLKSSPTKKEIHLPNLHEFGVPAVAFPRCSISKVAHRRPDSSRKPKTMGWANYQILLHGFISERHSSYKYIYIYVYRQIENMQIYYLYIYRHDAPTKPTITQLLLTLTGPGILGCISSG